MKIGAYQFKVTGEIPENVANMKRGVEKAANMGVSLLLFPECALTPRGFLHQESGEWGFPAHALGSSTQQYYVH